MRKAAIAACFAAALVMLTPWVAAQEKGKGDETTSEARPTEATPVKLAVTFAEFEGDKKVKSLPYTIYHNSSHNSILQADFTKLRIGSRVPVVTGSGGGAVQFQYLDIGANLDCRTVRNEDGKFLVQLSVERSWIEGDTSTQVASSAAQQNSSVDTFREPIIRNVRSDLFLSLRDGQTVETTAATDPISGRVVRIEVTLNVVK